MLSSRLRGVDLLASIQMRQSWRSREFGTPDCQIVSWFRLDFTSLNTESTMIDILKQKFARVLSHSLPLRDYDPDVLPQLTNMRRCEDVMCRYKHGNVCPGVYVNFLPLQISFNTCSADASLAFSPLWKSFRGRKACPSLVICLMLWIRKLR
jgi:hypothetical protein